MTTSISGRCEERAALRSRSNAAASSIPSCIISIPLARSRELMDKLLLTPEEVAEALGIGRTKVYELIRLGLIESVKINGCRRIPTVAVHEYVLRLRREAAA